MGEGGFDSPESVPSQSEFVPTSQKFVATLLLTPDYFLDADYDKLIKILNFQKNGAPFMVQKHIRQYGETVRLKKLYKRTTLLATQLHSMAPRRTVQNVVLCLLSKQSHSHQ